MSAQASLFTFTCEGTSASPSTPLIASEDGYIAIVFRDSVYLFKWDDEHPYLVSKIKPHAHLKSFTEFGSNVHRKLVYNALDRTKHSIIYASFTPILSIKLFGYLKTTFLVTCLDIGIVHYWLPTQDSQGPVLSINLESEMNRYSLSWSSHLFIEASKNCLGGFLQVVGFNDNLIFLWLDSLSCLSANDNKRLEDARINDLKNSGEATAGTRSRRMAATKAMEFYNFLATDEDDSEEYVKSPSTSSDGGYNYLEGDSPRAGNDSQSPSMLTDQSHRFIGKYAGYDYGILMKFDYRNPLNQELKGVVDMLKYDAVYAHSFGTDSDLTALRIGKLFVADGDLVYCNIYLTNTDGLVQILRFSFKEDFAKLDLLHSYKEDLLLITPSTLVFHELGQSCDQSSVVSFASSNQLFIAFKNEVKEFKVNYCISFLKIFAFVSTPPLITFRLIIYSNNNQIERYRVNIKNNAIGVIKIDFPDQPINHSKTDLENPYRIISIASIPSSYYLAYLSLSSNMFDLSISQSSDVEDLNAELLEIVSTKCGNLDGRPILISDKLLGLHPLSVSFNDSAKSNTLDSVFKRVVTPFVSNELEYYMGIISTKVKDIKDNDYFNKLKVLQACSLILYSFVNDKDVMRRLLVDIESQRGETLLDIIADSKFGDDNVRGLIGDILPGRLILKNISRSVSTGLLSVQCFCGEVSDCVSPFEYYICKNTHKVPACSITKCALGIESGSITINNTIREECYYKYRSLDWCYRCKRFGIGYNMDLYGCFICGTRTIERSLPQTDS